MTARHGSAATLTPRERLRRRQRELLDDRAGVREVEIPMRDGVMLAADLYAPADGGPAPAIVMWTPYDKSDPIGVMQEAERYRRAGYVFVAVDCRGRGKSEGEFRAWVHDGRDGYDTVEWVASQAWCDEAVGTTGGSYCGWAQWATAFEHPPSLRCMISTAGGGRFMEAMPAVRGCLHLTWFPLWCYVLRHRVMANIAAVDWEEVLWRLPLTAMADGLGIGGQTWADMLEHDRLDEFWRSLRFDGRYGELDVPVLHISGWWDHTDAPASIHHYLQAVEHARAPQQLIVGPWSHAGTRFPDDRYDGVLYGPDAALDMDAIHMRFFDRHLRGMMAKQTPEPEAIEPQALFFVTGANVWRSAERWPLPGTCETWHLDAADEHGALTRTSPTISSAASYVYDPNDPVRTAVDYTSGDLLEVPVEQTDTERRADVLTFTSSPLDRPLLICGVPSLEMFAATDGEDTDWHVKLTEVHADGRSMRFASGRVRASYADNLSAPSPVNPGEVRHYLIELDACTHEMQAGHRLRVLITSSDFPWFARNPNRFAGPRQPVDPRPARNTVACGNIHVSRLLLPVATAR